MIVALVCGCVQEYLALSGASVQHRTCAKHKGEKK